MEENPNLNENIFLDQKFFELILTKYNDIIISYYSNETKHIGKFTKNLLISAYEGQDILNIFKEIKTKIELNQFKLNDKDNIIELRIKKDNNKSLILQMRKIRELTYIFYKNKEEEFKNLIDFQNFIDNLKNDFTQLQNNFKILKKDLENRNNELKELYNIKEENKKQKSEIKQLKDELNNIEKKYNDLKKIHENSNYSINSISKIDQKEISNSKEGFDMLEILNKNSNLCDKKKVISLSHEIEIKISQKELTISINREIDFLKQIKLENLEALALNNNGIKDISPLENINLINLKDLNLSFNDIENIDSLTRVNCINLEHLFLQNNKILDISSFKNTNFQKLNDLRLNDNKIKEIYGLIVFKNLKTLYLDNNKIVDINIIQKFKYLKILFLHSNQISDISVFNKIDLSRFKYLYVYGNFIQNEIETEFNEKLEELNINE